MARRKKNTVDYFPHFSKPGKTIAILKQRWGITGYAFWFQLLELLSSSENHYYDCRSDDLWDYLIAYTGIDEVTAIDILNLLARLGNIDEEMWASKVIWCENLVANITDAYQNRRTEPPGRPIIDDLPNHCQSCGKVITDKRADAKWCSDACRMRGKRDVRFIPNKFEAGVTDDCSGYVRDDVQDIFGIPEKHEGISTPRNPHSKVNYSKVKESKGEESKEKKIVDESPSPSPGTLLLDCDSIFLKLVKLHSEGWSMIPDSRMTTQLRDLAGEIADNGGATEVRLYDAFKEAAMVNKTKVSYVRAILCSWLGMEKERGKR